MIWLVQLDLYFCQAGIKEELSRFRIAATLLPGHILRDFADILRSPPKVDPYTKLSEAIRQRFGRSVEQRLRTLLSEQQLGDRRPSQFLRHLLDLAQAAGSQDSPLVRQIFLNALPPRIQPFLQCLPTSTDLATTASTADRLLDLPPTASAAPTPHFPPATMDVFTPGLVHAVQQTPSEDLPALMRQLIRGITDLTTTVSTLVETTARRERSASTARVADHRRARDRSATPSPATPSTSLCWYHHKYGGSARSCQPPCSWTSENGN